MVRPRKGELVTTNSPFKKMRLRSTLSQEALARKMGVAVSTIRRWEKGKTEPTMTVQQMKNFCSAVGQSFHTLPNILRIK